MHNTPRTLLTAMALVLLAAACDGGGGGNSADASPPAEPPPTPPPTQLFTISGTITASPSQAADWDNNDYASYVGSNDSPPLAQPVANPITLGGYVNQPETGAEGRSYLSGDTDDFFRVELLAGQRITMLVADFQQADADLYLYDSAGRIVDISIESGELESLVIPRDGSYFVRVFAYDGATNYLLAIGNQNAQADSSSRFDIVPWQAVVKYRAAADKLATPGGSRVSSRLGLAQRAGGPGRTRLMGLRRGMVAALQGPAGNASGPGPGAGERFVNPQLRARWETLMAIKALRQDPLVEFAEPNYRVTALAVPDDEGYPLQWHYPLIDLPFAWDSTTGSPEVIVAVVDTGILSRHPDLRGQWVAGYDFISDRSSAGDGDGIDPDPEDPGIGLDPAATSFHGTHVGGTVAAAGDNGIGVTGAAYGARIMPLRALGADGGTSYDVDQAIRFAAGLANDSGTLPPQRADIINLSLGGAPYSQATQALLRQVREAGVMIVAAAGNEGNSLPYYPASYDGVLSVAAVDAQRRQVGYSNYGSYIDLAAPGGNNGVDLNGDGYPDGVLSTDGLGDGTFGYSFVSGTSMAAPHVAAVLALMKSVNPALSPADVDALLVRGDLSDDLGAPGRDDIYGYGLINAQRAVRAALAASGNPAADNPLLSASAETLNFASSASALELELRNTGGGTLELLEVATSVPWLAVNALDVDAAGLGPYQVSVDRNNLQEGVYTGDIIVRSSVNDLTVRVIMSVGAGSSSADVGVVYILLVDQETDEPVRQAAAAAQDGQYRFVFDQLAAGRYRVVAGTDADNDLYICDAGEACGAWLTLDQPLEITLEDNRDDIHFPVDYLIAIPNLTTSGQLANSDRHIEHRRLPSGAGDP